MNVSEYEMWLKQGNDFFKRKLLSDALTCYQRALKIFPVSVAVLSQLGGLYREMKVIDKEYKSLNRIIELNEDSTPLPIRMRLFELEKKFLFWDNLERDMAFFMRPEILNSGQVNPYFIGAYLPLTNEQRYHALQTWAKTSHDLRPKICPFSFADRKPQKAKLKLGFLSANFRPYPQGYVFGELIERIDRNKFEVYLYDAHPDLNSEPSKRIYGIKDVHIAQVNKMDDEQVAEKIFNDKIDVLIDMNGYTTYNRVPVLTYQPAPAQGTMLGYIGTLGGVPGVDYHFADHYSILPNEEKWYAEHVKYLEPTRWLIDHRIHLPQSAPLRRHIGFKEDDIILCCFNNAYKFTPNYFDLWSRILKRAPKAVLWFYTNTKIVEDNIKKEFLKRGIDTTRIVCSSMAEHAEHLARYKVADLLLDTEIYNAHTTSMEALFMGCPLITVEGTTYANRVGGAILTALEIPELICKNIQEYEDRVVDLCNAPNALKKLRERTENKVKTAPLFDMQKVATSLESAVREMYEESIANNQTHNG